MTILSNKPITLTQQVTKGSDIKAGHFPKWYGSNGTYSVEVAFCPPSRQWIVNYSKVACEIGIGPCYKRYAQDKISPKQAGRMIKEGV